MKSNEIQVTNAGAAILEVQVLSDGQHKVQLKVYGNIQTPSVVTALKSAYEGMKKQMEDNPQIIVPTAIPRDLKAHG